jgi:flavodoxin
MKTLLVYYSWTGNTRKLAQKITSKLKCDVEEINEKKKRKGKIGFMLGGFQAVFGMKTKIDKPKKDPSKYDLVLLGSPVWSGRITPALRSYISETNGISNYAFFCSKGGGEHGKAIDIVAKLVGKKPKASLAVKKSDIAKADVSPFLKKLMAKSP